MAKKKNTASKQIITYEFREDIIMVREVIPDRYEAFNHDKFIEPHRRNYFSFFLVTSGSINHSIDFNAQQCKQKDIFFLRPHQVYLVETAHKLGGIAVIFNPEILLPEESGLDIIRDMYNSNKLKLSSNEFNRVHQILRWLLIEYNSEAALARPMARNYLNSFLLHLSRIYQNNHSSTAVPPNVNKTVQQFLQLTEQQWQLPYGVMAYANQLHITPGHLNQLVKKQTGKKAIDWIQERKLLEIKRLLIYAEKSIKEIAYSAGFDDPAYFNRFFKKWTGATPLSFRQQNHEKYNPKP